MNNLRSLTISRCKNLRYFIHALDPDMNSSNLLICPKLKELVLRFNGKEGFDVEDVVGMARARVWRGAKFESVKIVNLGELIPVDISELKKHVVHVEYDLGVDKDY